MKAIDEYKDEELPEILDHACKMSIAVIAERWHEYKDMECLDDDDMHAVKKAMQVIQMIKCMHSLMMSAKT